MKNKKIYYVGYIIGILSLLLLFALDLSKSMEIILTFVFAISISFAFTKTSHEKMMKDNKNYRINVNDERNEKIRDKVNAGLSQVLMVLMGIIAVIAIATKAYITALLLALSVFLSPIFMYFLNSYYEKRY